MRYSACSGIAASIVAAAVVHAQAQPSRAEQLIKYRQAMYTVMGGNFAPLAAMVQGKAPFDPKEFVTRAERVAFVAQMLDEGFPADSAKGAPTRAKAQIWSERAEFDRLLDDLQAKSAELAQVARTGEFEQIKPALGDTGQACKACHDKFREKEKQG